MPDIKTDLTAETPLNPDTFQAFLTHIKSRPEELRWTGIPWETDLWEARLKAAAVSRPLFIWAMNGNPLGCV